MNETTIRDAIRKERIKQLKKEMIAYFGYLSLSVFRGKNQTSL